MVKQTIGQWLKSLATSNQSDELDGIRMISLLHRVGFQKAVVTCGIVYLDGHGTIDTPPMDIHSIAKMLIAKAHA